MEKEKEMTLDEKIKKANECVSQNNGLCGKKGYPPFDCEYCKQFRKRCIK